jgi:putative transposase
LRTHWVLVVMDQYMRRIVGFGVHAGTVEGVAVCRMFNHALRRHRWLPKYLSSDNDPLYRFHQWQANLRILEVTEIKTVPYVPLSHPSSKGPSALFDASVWTIHCSGRAQIWRTKCSISRPNYNHHRTHQSPEGRTRTRRHNPSPISSAPPIPIRLLVSRRLASSLG